MKYFDAHCHVQFSQYDEDRDHILARMREQGIGGLVVGTNRASSQAAVALAQLLSQIEITLTHTQLPLLRCSQRPLH